MTPSRARKSFSKASPYFFTTFVRAKYGYDGDGFNAIRFFRVISEDSAERLSLDESSAFFEDAQWRTPPASIGKSEEHNCARDRWLAFQFRTKPKKRWKIKREPHFQLNLNPLNLVRYLVLIKLENQVETIQRALEWIDSTAGLWISSESSSWHRAVRKSRSRRRHHIFFTTFVRTEYGYDGDRFNAVRLCRVISEDSAEQLSLDESSALLIEVAHWKNIYGDAFKNDFRARLGVMMKIHSSHSPAIKSIHSGWIASTWLSSFIERPWIDSTHKIQRIQV